MVATWEAGSDPACDHMGKPKANNNQNCGTGNDVKNATICHPENRIFNLHEKSTEELPS